MCQSIQMKELASALGIKGRNVWLMSIKQLHK